MKVIEKMLEKSDLWDIYEKVLEGKRLSKEDGLRLFDADLLLLGYMANIVRERLNKNFAYFIKNLHINYTNICINGCKFCAFSKRKGEKGAYVMELDEIFEKIEAFKNSGITEVHIVGGLNPDIPYSYYIDMLKGIREIMPNVMIQAFTCVEVAFIAEVGKKSVEATLEDLIEAGLSSIPGGGAEVFSKRIRSVLCPRKLPPEGWLFVAKTAHRMGIKSNATMLYGHIETYNERINHLIALRETQDETGGFLAFIPLGFLPENTRMEGKFYKTTGFDDLKTIAISRLMLDNFPHIKSFWIIVGPKLSQVSLSFGADDIDGTVVQEKISHSAGADTSEYIPPDELLHLIKEAGRTPVERDTLYNVIKVYE